MANHKSALKRARQSEERRVMNLSYKTRIKNAVKEVRTTVASNASDQAIGSLKKAVSIIQKSASKGIIHRKKASRKISRLTLHVNRIASS